jgi:septum formation protein
LPEPTKLILASASPRRAEILRGLGVHFEVEPSGIDESRFSDEDPATYVERVARAKANSRKRSDALILAADTIVVIDGAVLGKPADSEEARGMVGRLAGREHTVLTAVALLDGGSDAELSAVERSEVRIAEMTPAEIEWYVATGEPLDKAGAYAIQGLGSLFVESVHGNYTNIVGLPVPPLYRLIADLGYSLLEFRSEDSGSPALAL